MGGPDLLFAMTEEGRVRQVSGGYTYDYFLKDHLGNVRVVLSTDGTERNSVYPAATMETMTAATENTYYSNLDKVRSFTPVGFKSIKKNEKVAHLKGTDPNKQIGPSITVKVNSGDTINLTAQSFYPDNTSVQRTGLAETALSQLVNAIVNPAGLSDKGKAFATDNLKAQGFDKSASYQSMMNKLPNSDYINENNRPKAYMVWMLFDSEMKLVKTGKSSGARQIPEGAGQVKQMAETDILMDQGGFLTAYTVNESPASVYIDNFQLSVASGGLLEDNTYYPYGMLNAELSHPGNTDPINKYNYNGKELQTELSLQWLDYGARFYDPVIGRWHGVDPLLEKYSNISPYVYCHNNPVNMLDPNGLTDYLVSLDGHVNKKNPTWDAIKKFFGVKDEDDKLIAVDNKNNTLVMPAGSIGEIKKLEDDKGQYFNVSNDKVAGKVFDFLSENTGVEFGRTEYNNSKETSNVISTSYESTREGLGPSILHNVLDKGFNVTRYSHSHPTGDPPSGFHSYDKNDETSDKKMTISLNSQYTNNTIQYRMYDVPGRKYIYYNNINIYGYEKKGKK